MPAAVSAHMLEVGPNVVRQLCCGGGTVADDELVRAAFDSIDDQVTLVDLRPVSVGSLWQTVLEAAHSPRRERAIVVHPSWWTPTRVDVISTAAQGLGLEVLMRSRVWLLTQAADSQQATIVVEIADRFVVVSGAEVRAETRRGELQCVVEAVVRSILEMKSGVPTMVVIDAPESVREAGAVATMICEQLQCADGVVMFQVGDARLKELAAKAISDGARPCEPACTDAGDRHWKLWLVVMLVVAMLAVAGVYVSRRPAPRAGGAPTTFLVEGRVAVEVPSQWQIQRIVAGPGSARVQVTSPSDPEVALHVTQSRVPLRTLDATAEVLKHAIDAEPAGVFVDFNPVGATAGRPAVTYREVRAGHEIRWTVLVDKAVRISIGCQSRHGHDDAVRPPCDLAVRSARALG